MSSSVIPALQPASWSSPRARRPCTSASRADWLSKRRRSAWLRGVGCRSRLCAIAIACASHAARLRRGEPSRTHADSGGYSAQPAGARAATASVEQAARHEATRRLGQRLAGIIPAPTDPPNRDLHPRLRRRQHVRVPRHRWGDAPAGDPGKSGGCSAAATNNPAWASPRLASCTVPTPSPGDWPGEHLSVARESCRGMGLGLARKSESLMSAPHSWTTSRTSALDRSNSRAATTAHVSRSAALSAAWPERSAPCPGR